MACTTASSIFIPANEYASIHNIVKTRNMRVMNPEICRARGNIRSELSNDSVLKSCIPPICSIGMTATAITIIPSPPNHCSIALHSNIPAGISLSPVMTVAPVVVSPDIDSKKASVYVATAFSK